MKTQRHVNAFEVEHQNRAWLAWHVAALSGVGGKDFPKSPAELLSTKSKAKAEDWRTMERAALAWTVNQGGEVRQG